MFLLAVPAWLSFRRCFRRPELDFSSGTDHLLFLFLGLPLKSGFLSWLVPRHFERPQSTWRRLTHGRGLFVVHVLFPRLFPFEVSHCPPRDPIDGDPIPRDFCAKDSRLCGSLSLFSLPLILFFLFEIYDSSRSTGLDQPPQKPFAIFTPPMLPGLVGS